MLPLGLMPTTAGGADASAASAASPFQMLLNLQQTAGMVPGMPFDPMAFPPGAVPQPAGLMAPPVVASEEARAREPPPAAAVGAGPRETAPGDPKPDDLDEGDEKASKDRGKGTEPEGRDMIEYEGAPPPDDVDPAPVLSEAAQQTASRGRGMEPPDTVAGYRRDDLLRSKLRKPKVSVRKLGQYVRWLNTTRVWPSAIEVSSLHGEMRNGLLLCKLMKELVPKTEYKGLNDRPLSQRPAIANLEQALSVIWTSRRVNNTRVPSALDVYTGKQEKIAMLVQEIFEVYVMRDLRAPANMSSMLEWFDGVLAQYDRPLPASSLKPPFSNLWEAFRSGVNLFLVVLHFTGQLATAVATNGDALRADPAASEVVVDSARIVANPTELAQAAHNTEEVFALLRACGIDLLWTAEDWVSFPDDDFVVLQLHRVFSHFRDRKCALQDASTSDDSKVSRDIVDALRFQDCTGASPVASTDATGDTLLGRTMLSPNKVREQVTIDTPAAQPRRGEWNTSTVLEERAKGAFPTPNEANGSPRPGPPKEGSGSRSTPGMSPRSPLSPRKTPRATPTQPPSLEALERQQQQLLQQTQQSQREEVELEARFSALTLQASVMSEAKYDAHLKELEERKLELRTTQHNTNARLAEVADLMARARAGLFPKTPPSARSTKSGAAQQTPEELGKRAKALEKGWIDHIGKWDTHNALIGKTQRARTTPSQKGDDEASAPSSMNGASDDHVWECFKARLQKQQTHYLASKDHAVKEHLERLKEERSKSSSNGPLVSLPQAQPTTEPAARGPAAEPGPESLVTEDQAAALREIRAAIRAEELRQMHAEEERRWLVLFQQQQRERQLGTVGEESSQGNRFAAGAHSPKRGGVAGAAEWLSGSRSMSLKERNSERPFSFMLVRGDQVSTDAVISKFFAFRWQTEEGLAGGYVSLAQVSEIQFGRDPTVFKIVLQARNPQAVRRSGGLHEICIRAPAKSEADEYVKHLSALVNVPMA